MKNYKVCYETESREGEMNVETSEICFPESELLSVVYTANFLISKSLSDDPSNVPPFQITSVERCGTGTVSLSATAIGIINWYAAATYLEPNSKRKPN
jgi:hypothetical protein